MAGRELTSTVREKSRAARRPRAPKRKAYMVIGMHRSGTSAMARLLSFADACLPADLIPEAADNPAGFWESRSISDLNERILKTLGRGWDDPFPRPLPCTSQQWEGEAREAIRHCFPRIGSIIVKDPRISLLAPFWMKMLRSEDYAPSAILMSRPIEDVTASLTVRNKMPSGLGWLLSAQYMAAAERNTRNIPRVFVDFNAVIDKPDEVLNVVGRKLSISEVTNRQRKEIRAFIQPALRHHHTRNGLSNNSFGEIAALARAYSAATEGASFRRASTDRCTAWLSRVEHWFAPIREADLKQQTFLESEILKHKHFEDHLNTGVKALRVEIDRLTVITLEQQAEIQRLTRVIAETRSSLNRHE